MATAVLPSTSPNREPRRRPRVAPVDPPRLTILTELIGNTPMLDLSAQSPRESVRIYAKAEYCNPGGSIKDRPALAMVSQALAQGLLDGERRVLDATSGNTGIAYAMLGAALGFGVTLCLPQNASAERRRLLRAYGAELVLTDPLQGSDGAILEARRLAAEHPDRYVYLDQYGNPENWLAHYRTTGPEIWRQTNGEVTHFVTGLGTSGTFVGVGRFLREVNPQIKLVSVEPDGPFHGLEGMKHMESAMVPPIYDRDLADEKLTISTERAYAELRRLGREAGLLVGVSAAANVAAASQVARTLERGLVVTVLCDNITKYLAEPSWEKKP